MSNRIKSGCTARAFSSPSAPVVAVTTSIPASSRRKVARTRFCALSSTNNILCFAMENFDRSGGDLKREARAFAPLALGPNLPAQKNDEVFAEIQPQTGALVNAAVGVLESSKLTEQNGQLFRGHSNSCVAHGHQQPVSLGSRLQADLSLVRKFNRVAQEVQHDLVNLLPVRINRRVHRHVRFELQMFELGCGLNRLEGFLDQRRKLERLDEYLVLARLDPGQVQQVINQVQQVLRRTMGHSQI